jgi:phosphatidylethanolamine-binding protein (PEBP) family uncharacterized protein
MMFNKKTTLFVSFCLLFAGACNNDKFIKPNKLVSIQLDNKQVELKTGDKKDKLLACVKVVGAENDPDVVITMDKNSPDADFFQLGKDEQKCGALPALLLNKDLPNDFDITKPLQVKLIATRGNETKNATFTFTVLAGEDYIKPAKITSTAIKNGYIGSKFTPGFGGNTSPEITVSNIPADVTTIAIMIVDQFPGLDLFPHGLLTFTKTKSNMQITEGDFDDFGTILEPYVGPSPPSEHSYEIRVYSFKRGDVIPTDRTGYLALTENLTLGFKFNSDNPNLGD